MSHDLELWEKIVGVKPAKFRKFGNFRYAYIVVIILMISNGVLTQEQTVLAPDLTEQNLHQFIQFNYTPEYVQGYDNARDILYSDIDNLNGIITGVYSGYSINLVGSYCDCENGNDECSVLADINDCQNSNGVWEIETDPSVEAYYKGINVEHTWPQSWGAGSGNPRADMHHLFPTKANVNSSRGEDPFDEIDDELTHKWYRHDEILLNIPDENIDEYAEKFNPVDQPELETFEPREEQKGNTARAMFYFYAIYNDVAPEEFWNVQKSTLLEWHYDDPVDDTEFDRTFAIAGYQDELPNPFVLDSTLARRIWFYSEQSTNTQVMFQQAQFTVEEGSGEMIIPVEIINHSENSSTGCTVSILSGTANYEDVDFNDQTVQFTQGSNQPQLIVIEILDDDVYEGEEYIVLSIQDVWGGENDDGIAGNPGTLTIYISDNDAPGLTITEVMVNPSAVSDENGEWFEVYNPGSSMVEMHNWLIRDAGSDDYMMTQYAQIPPESYFVFGRNDNPLTNGGVIVGFEYSGIQLGNNGDELILVSPEGVVSDSIGWDDGYLYPHNPGISMSVIDPFIVNDDPSAWQASNLIFGDGDYGTPGLENCFSPDEYDECGICDGDGTTCSTAGDINQDGLINVVDVVLIVDHILTDSNINEEAADMNGDSLINIVDIVWIVNLILY